ncbi:MAG: hypothetical protein NC240_10345 [Clostridium sp.]|nr:hypothetical protein [Clostridium sp.]
MADMQEDIADEITVVHDTVELYDAKKNVVKAENLLLVYLLPVIWIYKQDAIFGSCEYKHQCRPYRSKWICSRQVQDLILH